MTETARYMGRCRTCPYRAAVDAELFSVTTGGRTSSWFGIPVLDEDHDDYTRARRAQTEALWAASGITGLSPRLPAHVRMPQPPAWVRFQLDMDGIARRALIRVGLWCPTCSGQIRVTPLKATRNEGKRCSDVCKRATSITCDCSCGGQMHGRAWLAGSVRIGA